MIALIKSWLIGIVCCAVAVAIADNLMPKGAVKRVSKLLCGIILLIATVKPLIDIDFSTLSRYMVEYNNAAGQYSADLSEVNERLSKVIIEEQSAAYILDKATSLDMDVTAEVEARRGDGELWYPYEATLSGEYTDAQKNELSELIEAELAIPAQRQNWLR